jgi:hypothetical protein
MRRAVFAGFLLGCTRVAAPVAVHDTVDARAVDVPVEAAAQDAPDAQAAVPEPDEPMAVHKDTKEDLLALFSFANFDPATYAKVRPDIFLAHNVGPGVASKMNQGNKAIAHHAIGKHACEAALAGIVIQTDDQKTACKGMPNMVPVYKGGDIKAAHYCIDAFEFPNKPCELPFVWTAPTFAQTMCQLQGKRLCTQEEWSFACRGDPAGGADRLYAYGDDLDLAVCNTNKSPPDRKQCDARTLQGAWSTCGTHTEPSGSSPKCRSRFGVFDQHGNVAEVMTRTEKDGKVVTQLKGSAFFYVEVAQKPGEWGDVRKYPDHCNYDPRWHVEPIESAWHVNYHLGFRCCMSL